MSVTRRPASLLFAIVVTLLAISLIGVPAALGQEATVEITQEPVVNTQVPTAPPPDATSTPAPTALPTQTPAPEQTAVVTPEQTAAVTPETTVEITPEVTEPPTQSPTEEPIAVATEEATNAAPQFGVNSICTPQGIAFVITNNGPDMTEAAAYALLTDTSASTDPIDEPSDEPTAEPEVEPTADPIVIDDEAGLEPSEEVVVDEAPTDIPNETPVDELTDVPVEAPAPEIERTPFLLLAGESLTIPAGFGAPQLQLGDVVYAAESDCALPVPVLSVSAVCSAENGVEFTLINSGGPMETELAYMLTSDDAEPVEGVFLLDENEEMLIAGGFGAPVFTSGELTGAIEEPCLAPAEIRGVIWNDANGDGVRDDGEPGLPDVSVTLTDPAGFVLSAASAADGTYLFAMLPTSSYTVAVDTTTLSSDFALTFPTGSDAASVTLDAVQGMTYDADFGFAGAPTASVSGIIWLETTNFGVRDDGEMGVAGLIVELVDAWGSVIDSAPVDVLTGAYTFSDVMAGSYTVRLAQETLFTPNGITFNSDADLNYETPITLTTGQALPGVDFGVVGTF